MRLLKRIIPFSAILCGGSMAWAQFAHVFEMQATSMNEVNAQLYELNMEKRHSAALEIVVKAIGNLEKQQGVIPNFNPASVFEIAFDDAISTKQKTKISIGEIFNFQMLPEFSRSQILTGLELKYSSAFFDMALQMRRFQLHHAYSLSLAVKSSTGAATLVAENKAFEEIAKILSFPILLKSTTSGITYVFDLADILSASISKSAISTEYASINSRLIELYMEIANDSKNPDLVALKNSKRPNAVKNKLFADMQMKKAAGYKIVMATEGNKANVQ